jgi:AcrR family transcriptional regulator
MNDAQVRTLRSDTLQTRQTLVKAAERLFAIHGIDAVSMNEITREAGQKNKSALNYHFGSREALLQAVLDRHAPQVTAEREAMLDNLSRQETVTLPDVVKALILPLAAKMQDEDGGVAYLRINAQLLGNADMHLYRLRQSNTRKSDSLMRALAPLVSALPAAQEKMRMQLVGSFLFHALADQATLQLAMSDNERKQQTKLFVNQLVIAISAMLSVNSDGEK